MKTNNAKNRKVDVFGERWSRELIPRFDKAKFNFDISRMATFGSCFARNFERWCRYFKLTKNESPWKILFNPFAIKTELLRLHSAVDWETHVIQETYDGQASLRDPWRTWITEGDMTSLARRNKEFDLIGRGYVESAKCFLITLGLAEVWTPKAHDSTVLNRVPIEAMNEGADLWESRFAKASELKQCLMDIVEIALKINPNAEIVFTLSPVPLKFSASRLSVREANTVSKSLLRTAIFETVNETNRAKYFPSFELVHALGEKPNTVWQPDGRHVTAHVINRVVNTFCKCCGLELDLEPKQLESFWVPYVDESGKIKGKLFANGEVFLNKTESNAQ